MGAVKKIPCPTTTKAKPDLKVVNATDNAADKVEIERMKKLLAEKIKDPNLAKKAALIISEMVNSKK